MKKIIAVAAIFVLAACGGSEGEGEAAGAEEESSASMVPVTTAGTYVGTDSEGTEVTFMLNEDGTFEHSMAGEVVRTGTWEDTMRGTCFVEEGVEGEQCYNIVETADDGMVDVTGPDGVTMSMTKAS